LDQVGSPNLESRQDGSLAGLTKNLPFGERFGQVGEIPERRYTNHEDQPGSAIYMQARTYLPVYGRFAQVDPAYDQTKDDPESWNLYNYVTNNPVTHTDPDGRYGTVHAREDDIVAHNTGGTAMADSVVLFENLVSQAIRDGISFNVNLLSAKLLAEQTEANKKTVTTPVNGSQTATGASGSSGGALTASQAASQLMTLAGSSPGDAAALTRAANALSDPTTTTSIVPDGAAGAGNGGESNWTDHRSIVPSGNGVAPNTQFINMTKGAAGNLQDWGHEGTHNADRLDSARAYISSGKTPMTMLESERNAYSVTQTVLRLTNTTGVYRGVTLWDKSWSRMVPAQRDALQAAALSKIVAAEAVRMGAGANNPLVY
jgi:RHS repeat-associated protein